MREKGEGIKGTESEWRLYTDSTPWVEMAYCLTGQGQL